MADRYIDLTGQRFGRLLVQELCPNRSKGSAVWKCICDCGVEKEISARYLLRSKGASTSSCGCLRRDKAKELSVKYPLSSYKHGYYQHPLYQIWSRIKRLSLANNISIASKWIDSPEKFISWAEAKGWSKGMILIRKKPELGYIPSNCLFVPRTRTKPKPIIEEDELLVIDR